MRQRKVFINSNNEGEIVCPHCKTTRVINIPIQHLPSKPIKVKCKCEYNFIIILEYRKYYRKSVIFPGKLFDVSSNKEIDDVNITSLSVTGVGFEVTSYQGVNVNDILKISFRLDENFDSTICEEIVVKRVKEHFVGAEFCDQDKYQYELDFFMSSQMALIR
jgi:hypothetical protein